MGYRQPDSSMASNTLSDQEQKDSHQVSAISNGEMCSGSPKSSYSIKDMARSSRISFSAPQLRDDDCCKHRTSSNMTASDHVASLK